MLISLILMCVFITPTWLNLNPVYLRGDDGEQRQSAPAVCVLKDMKLAAVRPGDRVSNMTPIFQAFRH